MVVPAGETDVSIFTTEGAGVGVAVGVVVGAEVGFMVAVGVGLVVGVGDSDGVGAYSSIVGSGVARGETSVGSVGVEVCLPK